MTFDPPIAGIAAVQSGRHGQIGQRGYPRACPRRMPVAPIRQHRAHPDCCDPFVVLGQMAMRANPTCALCRSLLLSEA